jgi:uncharacterized damage-inducible protein DinB
MRRFFSYLRGKDTIMTLTPEAGFPYYISLIGNNAYQYLFQRKDTFELLSGLTQEQAEYRYAEGKWSIKEIVAHMADHERIMIYRALRFSRKDTTPLPGYDQNVLINNGHFDQIHYEVILQDFVNVRNSTLSFIKTLVPEQMHLTGMAWKFELSVDDVLKATIGHELHHVGIIRERYLN